MKTYTCDKCGKDIFLYSENGHIVSCPPREGYYNDPKVTGKREQFDLCKDCIISLREWITGETLERMDE